MVSPSFWYVLATEIFFFTFPFRLVIDHTSGHVDYNKSNVDFMQVPRGLKVQYHRILSQNLRWLERPLTWLESLFSLPLVSMGTFSFVEFYLHLVLSQTPQRLSLPNPPANHQVNHHIPQTILLLDQHFGKFLIWVKSLHESHTNNSLVKSLIAHIKLNISFIDISHSTS